MGHIVSRQNISNHNFPHYGFSAAAPSTPQAQRGREDDALDSQDSRGDDHILQEFYDWIDDQGFPCVGAKAAYHKDRIKTFIGDDFLSALDDEALTHHLQDFARHFGNDGPFTSFVAIYRTPHYLDEAGFETALWRKLSNLHHIDEADFNWDKRVSSDPGSPHFSFSIGGEGFYVIGLHSKSSRKARRAPNPTLVFNLHNQFEILRERGQYQALTSEIAARDNVYSGSVNPMIAPFGESSEARQYSGRKTGQDWNCPFSAGKKQEKK